MLKNSIEHHPCLSTGDVDVVYKRILRYFFLNYDL